MTNQWSADGYPGWSADGAPGWSADGAIVGGVIGAAAGTLAPLVGSGAGLVFPVNVLGGGKTRNRRPIEGTAAAQLVALRATGVGRFEDPPVPVVGVAHGLLAPLSARAKFRHGVKGRARGICASVQGHARGVAFA